MRGKSKEGGVLRGGIGVGVDASAYRDSITGSRRYMCA